MENIKYIVIGGSAGSFQTITSILDILPEDFNFPVFLVLHRLKQVRTGFVEALSIKSKLKILEPIDKERILPQRVYLSPANYHMYIEPGNFIGLSTEEPVNHSRPAIDITLASGAYVFGNQMLAILLSGANRDGAAGMKTAYEAGAFTIVQDPDDCQVNTMTKAAISKISEHRIMTAEDIVKFLLKLDENAKKQYI